MNLRPEIAALVAADPARTRALQELLATATRSLERNIVMVEGNEYLTAGPHQFKSLWTRDFCWSARGLLAIGRKDVVRAQLQLLLDAPGDGRPADLPYLLPRTFDSMDTNLRVATCAPTGIELPLGAPLRPHYLDQHGRPAVDGNMLAVLAADLDRRVTGDSSFWDANKKKLVDALRVYDDTWPDGKPHFRADGLIRQPPFSDWQDSVRRQGKTFYSNLVYACVMAAVADDPIFGVGPNVLPDLRKRIDETFRDPSTGLYLSQEGRPQISLDGNLLAIDLGYVSGLRAQELLRALRAHLLWKKEPEGPGFVTVPPYPDKDKDGVDKVFASLRGYHDTLYWSWLMALAAKTAARDRGAAAPSDSLAILDRLVAMAHRDGSIAEIFDSKPGLPRHDTFTYKSERPFSWGAAFVIDALSTG